MKSFFYATAFLAILYLLSRDSRPQKTPEPDPTPSVSPSTQVEIPVPSPDPVMPEFKTVLWEYKTCVKDGYLGSCEPQKYIMPDNEVVKFVASFLDLKQSESGTFRLVWKQPIKPLNASGVFQNNYISDDKQFNYPSNGDIWINPDWYFTHGMKGDCEDGAFAAASILESKGVKTKIVIGYLTVENIRSTDALVEFKIDNKYYRYLPGADIFAGFVTRDRHGIGSFKINNYVFFEPFLMFDKKTYYETYKWNW